MLRSILIALVTFLPALGSPVHADMGGLMNDVYDGMTTSAPAGPFNSQRRSGWQGGSYSARSPITSVNLVNFTPPSFSAGCGGVDLFGGSISFINSNEFEQLLRSIMSNATGLVSAYAFKLAMSVFCDTCTSIMTELQEKIQEMNQWMGDSCAIAESAVSAFTNSDIGQSIEAKAKEWGTETVTYDDSFDAWMSTDSPQQKAEQARAAGATNITVPVNIGWHVLTQTDASAGAPVPLGEWFPAASTDNDLLEFLMNMFPIVIVQEAANASGQMDYVVVKYVEKIDAKTLWGGAQGIEIVGCADIAVATPRCTATVPRTVNVPAFQDIVRNILVDGIATKAGDKNAVYTTAEQAMINYASYPVLRYLSVPEVVPNSNELRRKIAEVMVPKIARDMTIRLVEEIYDSAIDAGSKFHDQSWIEQWTERLELVKQDAKTALEAEYVTIDDENLNMLEVLVNIQQLVDPETTEHLPTVSTKAAGS